MSALLSLNIKDNHSPETSSSRVGRTGEKMAAEFLVLNHYVMVAANFRVPIGRNRLGATVAAEIDLIAYDRDVLCFIEVKTRSSDAFAAPISAVTLRKQRQITRAARVYRNIFQLRSVKFRYDVVGIVIGSENRPDIALYKGFWSENKFLKSNRSDNL